MNKKHNKDDIIAAGSELFRFNGYAGTNLDDILHKTKIPKGSFYNFFKNKEDFAIQSLDYYGKFMQDYMRPYLNDTSKTPLKRLKAFYFKVIEVNEGEAFRAGCLVNNLSVEVGGINENLSKASNRSFYKLIELISQTVREAQLAGEIRNDYSETEIAEYLHMGFYGGLSRMKAQKNTDGMRLFFKMAFEFLTS